MNGAFDDRRRALFLHRLEALLETRDMDDKSLSRRAGLGDGAVGDIMRGKSTKPNIDTLMRIASALGTSVGYLIGEADDDRGLTKAISDATRLRTEREELRRLARAILRLLDEE